MAESIKQQEQQRMDRVVAQIKKAQKKAQKISLLLKAIRKRSKMISRIISVSRRELIRG